MSYWHFWAKVWDNWWKKINVLRLIKIWEEQCAWDISQLLYVQSYEIKLSPWNWGSVAGPVIQANGGWDLRMTWGLEACFTVHWVCWQYGHSGGTQGWLVVWERAIWAVGYIQQLKALLVSSSGIQLYKKTQFLVQLEQLSGFLFCEGFRKTSEGNLIS